MRVVAIIQARMGSERFPGKTLKTIEGQPILGYLLDRLRRSETLTDIVLATTTSSSDNVLCDWASANNLAFYRGSPEDVLDRYYQCADRFKADVIVRITSDDPLKDPAVIDRAVNIFVSGADVDYVSNTIKPTFPEGIDVEVFGVKALRSACERAVLMSDREHVTPYIWRNTDVYSVVGFTADQDDSDIRLTVDYPADLFVLNELASRKGSLKTLSFSEIVELVRQNPDLMKLNNGIVRNEGYIRSRAEDLKNEK